MPASPPAHVGAPVLTVLASVASVQVGAALAKQLFGAVGTTGTVAVRVGVAALVCLAVVRPRRRDLDARRLGLAALLGLVLLALNLTFYASIGRIPLAVAVTLEFVGPLAVAVVGTRRPADLLWAALAGAGVVLLTGGGRALLDGSLDPVGTALALLAGVGWAGYIVVSKRVGAVLPGFQGLAVAFTVAAVVAFPAGLVTAGTALLEPRVLAVGALVGVLSSALPAALEMAALRALPTATFGVLMSLEPVGAAAAGLVVLGERLSPIEVGAILVVCVASAGAALSPRPARKVAQWPTPQQDPTPTEPQDPTAGRPTGGRSTSTSSSSGPGSPVSAPPVG